MFKKTQTVCSFLWWWFLISKRNTIATAFPCQGWNHFCNWNVRGVLEPGFFDSTKFWEEFWKQWKLQHKIPQQAKHQKNTATTEVIHQAISPIKTSKQKHLPVCPFLFPKKRHQQFDPTTTPASFDSLQVFQVSPPFRDQRITPRRDSLSLRWQLPSFATWVELQHDGGFGGNWTHTLAIRWGFGWGWKGHLPRKRKMTSGAHFGVEGAKYPNFCSPQTKYYVFSCWGCGEKHIW